MNRDNYFAREIEYLDLNKSPLIRVARELERQKCERTEKYIREHINPKPRWLPLFFWHWMIKKVLRVIIEPPSIDMGFQWSEPKRSL